jgi:hypothetical protein
MVKIVMKFICNGCKTSYGRLKWARDCEAECLAVKPRYLPGNKVRVKDGGMPGEIICFDRIAVLHSGDATLRTAIYLVMLDNGARRPFYEYELGYQEIRVQIDGTPESEPVTS